MTRIYGIVLERRNPRRAGSAVSGPPRDALETRRSSVHSVPLWQAMLAANTTLTGAPTFTSGPTGVSAPFLSLMRNTASVSLSWLAAIEPLAGGVDREVAGRLAARWLVFDQCEVAGGHAHLVHGDAVVAAVGAVQKRPPGCTRISAVELFPAEPVRQRGDRRQRLERPARAVPRIGRDGRRQLVDGKAELPFRVKREMPRPRARRRGDGGLQSGRQPAASGVVAVDEQPVGAQVRGDREAVVGVQVDRVRVRRGLPLGVDARSLVLHDLAGTAKRPVGLRSAARQACRPCSWPPADASPARSTARWQGWAPRDGCVLSSVSAPVARSIWNALTLPLLSASKSSTSLAA